MQTIHIPKDNTLPKFLQIANSIILEIEKGSLQKNDQLPSITVFSKQNGFSRDTVEKAFKKLIEEGYVQAIKGKGNYILGRQDVRLRVLLVFNKLSSYKKIIYDAIVLAFGDKARVELKIHHYNPQSLAEIVEESLGNYHYYVIMPHFFHHAEEESYLKIFDKIPSDQLLILDKNLPGLKHEGMAVYQDFKKDVFSALLSASDLMDKYTKIIVVFPKYSNHPVELNEGVLKFCMETHKQFSVIADAENEAISKESLYIVLTESDLAALVKKAKNIGLQLGKDIGILSFNETILKELLDITVITTDFEEMGKTAAQLILSKNPIQIKNPFRIIRRNSV